MFKLKQWSNSVTTFKIPDEEEQEIVEYIKQNPEKFQGMSAEDSILKAINDLEILLCEYFNISDIDEEYNSPYWGDTERSAKEVLGMENKVDKKQCLETAKIEIELILKSETDKEKQYSKLLYYYTNNIEQQHIISFEEYMALCRETGYEDRDI